MADEISAVLNTENGPIATRDLSYFLYLFRAAYVAAHQEINSQQHVELATDYQALEFSKTIKARIANFHWSSIRDLALYELHPKDELSIIDISRRNPLDIVFAATPPALIVAVIIAGGSFQFNSGRIILPSLKNAITNMRVAFGQQPQQKITPPREDQP
ncbi:hypothetical protein ABIB42_002349 [Massilia sp. UYP32]|jgi:hypothetical protein|uniref:hypothetical protein n=1 Tax=Massilia TaxID=149698 RepID=UPI0012FC9DEC|nr:hypothetical protein [Massilia timonae]